MKRSKLLIPTLTCLSIVPAIVSLSSCNKDNTEQEILDAIFNPLKKEKEVCPEDTFVKSFKAMSDDDKKKELIYDIFCAAFIGYEFDDEKKTIADFYNNNEGGFKINITKCDIAKDGDDYKASFLGYISYVFAKQHQLKYDSNETYLFNANDYLMVTFDFVDVKMTPVEVSLSYSYSPTYGSSLGFLKFRFESGKKEALIGIEGVSTAGLKHGPANSKNWINA